MSPLESFPGLHAWLETPLGRHVMDWEAACLDRMVVDVFGYNAVQLGIPECDFLRANRMPLRLRAGAGRVQVETDYAALPFESQSLDLVVLAHVLEFAHHPHHVLREVERVLVPEGQLIITGFNPVSLFGLRRRLKGESGSYPWHGQYLSTRRIKDWLELLSFEPGHQSAGCFIPAQTEAEWLQRLRFVERAGERWCGFAGGVYVLQAVKRVQGMRLIMPKWDRLARARALAPLVSRVGRQPDPQKTMDEQDFGRN
ncbi:class I SAM-dependent methyltransferase [Zoogloea sp.]|uniref:class I SAM-dependent methyltransferase n=2 Tax=Zoogloea sp. TaxID=49181 RepID=UPI0035B0D116